MWQRSDVFSTRIMEVLEAAAVTPGPRDARVVARWRRDGVDGEVVSWVNAWGPRTEAFVLRSAGDSGPLPGVLALHSHGGVKSVGKEMVADGPEGRHPAAAEAQAKIYGDRAFANELARRGYVVLAHDAFSWGSRGFTLDAMGSQPGSPGETVCHELCVSGVT